MFLCGFVRFWFGMGCRWCIRLGFLGCCVGLCLGYGYCSSFG